MLLGEEKNKEKEKQNKFGMKQKKKAIEDRSDQALDYYYRGIRIDNKHFGCCFNIALIFLNKVKLNNAYKWF